MRRNVVKNAVMVISLSLFWGCADIAEHLKVGKSMNVPESPPQEVTFPVRQIPSDGSLWRANGQKGLFRDLRAQEVGDLVTVNIAESSKASKKANTKTSRESSIEAGINNALGWETKIKEIASLGNKKVRAAVDTNSLFRGSLQNEFTGEGETNRDESMTASITARVTAVTPEGNLYIMGTREVKVNLETQFITLTGLIRPEDISPDNTVLSSYIADARIAYSGSGPVSDKQRPGWLMRFADFIWPF